MVQPVQGEQGAPFKFPIEQGKVLEFVESVTQLSQKPPPEGLGLKLTTKLAQSGSRKRSAERGEARKTGSELTKRVLRALQVRAGWT